MAQLTLGSIAVRQLNGLFSLNDLHAASGCNPNHRPGEFIRNQQTQELVTELTNAGISAFESRRGSNGGTYACRELVIAYAAWISAAFHLKVIRVFLAAQAAPRAAAPLPPPTPRHPTLRARIEAIGITAHVQCGHVGFAVRLPVDSYNAHHFRVGDTIEMEYRPNDNPLATGPVGVRLVH